MRESAISGLDLDMWWQSLPLHHRWALQRVGPHPLPHTLARVLLAHPRAAQLVELRGEGDRARCVLAPGVAEYVVRCTRLTNA